MDKVLYQTASRLAEQLLERQLMLATAESCTGGWVAKVLTDLPGCSAWFDRGFVTYTNASKHEMLGVPLATLEAFGAVSEATVREMVEGVLRHSPARVSLAISGIAGPTGATEDKPLGTVWFGWAVKDKMIEAECRHFEGDREAVRAQAVKHTLSRLIGIVQRHG